MVNSGIFDVPYVNVKKLSGYQLTLREEKLDIPVLTGKDVF
jgi:hypothetical protein